MDTTIKYKLTIDRSSYGEELQMALYGSNTYAVEPNSKLLSTGSTPGEISDTKTLQIYTRNI